MIDKVLYFAKKSTMSEILANPSAIVFNRQNLSDETLINLYKKLLYPRLIEDKMLILIRQGKVSKWFSGVGQEAISVGCTAALLPDEMIFTMHRNLGVFTTRDVPLSNLYAQWQGKANGYTKGRDRSFHFGTMEHHIVGMISHLGPQLSLAAGVALAHKLRNEKKVSLAFTGEGATSQGEFHEALNVASVWKLPVIFIIENNQYGLSTPTNEQYACKDLVDRAIGYGMKGVMCDGNNILEVYNTISQLAAGMRENPEPVLVEMKTFRVRGHEEASGTKYVPGELQKAWAAKDPVENFEHFLLENGLITEGGIENLKRDFKAQINVAADAAFALPSVESTIENEIQDVYATDNGHFTMDNDETRTSNIVHSTSEKRFIDAISDGLRLSMQKHENLVLMGQDIAEYGGVFKITDGFVAEFGKGRVRNTPLCESAIVGCALGLSLAGMKAMVEMQFADFVSCGFNQIVNNLAKLHYRWGQNADVVIRMPTGGGMGAGPFHSQSNEAWFTHTPGLKVVYPSNPHDAKGLLIAAINDPNSVLFFEHKALYRTLSAEIPDDYYTVEIGKAAVINSKPETQNSKPETRNPKISIITYGMGVHWAIKVVSEMDIDAEIIDLRTLVPLDYETMGNSVKKTNKALILHEDTLFGGIGGEIAAWISEHLFEYLDAPVLRVGSLDTPIPFAVSLEKLFLPEARLKTAIEKLLKY
jgi:2-oxoisovalerate dehydrogenase E1 component